MKYLFATDGSQISLKALHTLSAFVKNKENEELLVLSVAKVEFSFFDDSEEAAKSLQASKDKHTTFVNESVKIAEQLGFKNVKGEAVLGDPREQIINYAESHGVECIAMGARGLGFLHRLLIGSVSEYVLKHANCNVLIARN